MRDALPTKTEKGSFSVLLRFLPLLWPKDAIELRFRVVIAVLLVLAGKAIGLTVPYALKWVVDSMSGPVGGDLSGAAQAVILLVLAYAGAAFCSTICATPSSRRSDRTRPDGLRHACFGISMP
jgi:ATP-binding cassette subfamily B protein